MSESRAVPFEPDGEPIVGGRIHQDRPIVPTAKTIRHSRRSRMAPADPSA